MNIKHKLGEYITTVDIRNKNLTVNRLLGVSINKTFIESIANTIGTDFSNYKIVRRGQFAYCPVTSRNGEKISVALLKEDDCIISSSYTVFEVIDNKKLLPEYLMLWFMRPEFDRFARFKSHGSVREIFDWQQMCDVELSVPDIEKQKKIVDIYKIITDRIVLKNRINKNLEEQAQAIYKSWFAGFEANGILSDIADITMGQSPDGTSYNMNGVGTVFFQGRTDFGYRFPSERIYTIEPKKFAEKNDILMSVRAPVGDLNIANQKCCIGRGLASIRSKDNHSSFLLYTLLNIKNQLDIFNGQGTVFGSINQKSLKELSIVIPPYELLEKFEKIVSRIDKKIENNYSENHRLSALRDLLIPKLINGEKDVTKIKI